MDRLRDYNDKDYEGIIFDDMSFKHIPREGQIHLVDTYDDRDIHCRYSPAFIPAGTPRIITSNKAADEVILAADPAIARRIQCVWIDGPVFNTQEKPVDDRFSWVEERNRSGAGEGSA